MVTLYGVYRDTHKIYDVVQVYHSPSKIHSFREKFSRYLSEDEKTKIASGQESPYEPTYDPLPWYSNTMPTYHSYLKTTKQTHTNRIKFKKSTLILH